ncbi:transporter substrate-binding domain-containing protein [Rhodobacteraceae bacterium D3-12]|nr:transporter substrate-binding domain-containing protein [Rhodobacteraceae bacterium D3-12]
MKPLLFARLSHCLSLCLALSLPAMARADTATGKITGPTAGQTVRIATEGAFPPFNSLNAAGAPIGFEIDLGNAVCAHQGWTCDWVLHEWSGIIGGLTGGDYDAIMAGMSITPSRLKDIDFTREYFLTANQPKGMFVGIHNFLDPAHSLIAVQEDTIHEEHLKSLGFRTASFATAGAALDAVLAGRCDLTFGSPDYLDQRLYRTGRALSVIGTMDIQAGGAAVAVPKGRDKLRRGFNAALDSLESDGTIERLRKKWFAKSTDI